MLFLFFDISPWTFFCISEKNTADLEYDLELSVSFEIITRLSFLSFKCSTRPGPAWAASALRLRLRTDFLALLNLCLSSRSASVDERNAASLPLFFWCTCSGANDEVKVPIPCAVGNISSSDIAETGSDFIPNSTTSGLGAKWKCERPSSCLQTFLNWAYNKSFDSFNFSSFLSKWIESFKNCSAYNYKYQLNKEKRK